MQEHSQDTRTRLIECALELFAERGFKGTTIADIESGAGVVPRSGTFYHHFESKRAVLDAAVQLQLEKLGSVAADALALLPLGDLRSEMLLVGRTISLTFEANKPLVLILEKEGDQLGTFRQSVREQILGLALGFGVQYLRSRLGDRADALDLEAAVSVLGGAVINYRRALWTMGRPPMDIDEDRYLAVWTDVVMAYLESAG